MDPKLDFSTLDRYLLSQKGKIIHQIWFGTIPNKTKAKKAYNSLKTCRDSWKIKNPDWCCIEWNRDWVFALMKTYFSEYLDTFKKYKYEIQRCDSIRYFILYRYGGFYADMDYYCNRPVNEILATYKNPIYFVQSPNSFLQDEDHISNSLMYSEPGNQFWKIVFLEMAKVSLPSYYPRHLQIMLSTGPGLLNRIYSRCKYSSGLKSYPWKLFHPYGIGDLKMSLKINKEIYAIHLGKGSWELEDSKLILFFYTNLKLVGIIIFLFCFLVKNYL